MLIKIKTDIHHMLDKIFLSNNLLSQLKLYNELLKILNEQERICKYGDDYFLDPAVKQYIKKSQQFFYEWETKLESIMQYHFLHKNFPANLSVEIESVFKLRQHYIEFYRGMAQIEIKSANIGSTTKVCFIGVGSMPLSLLMLHKYTGCYVAGIDILPKAIEEAKACISVKSIQEPEFYNENRILLSAIDGANMNFSDFDVVIIASSVQNKPYILKKIYQSKNKNMILIDREVSGFAQYIYQSSQLGLNSNCLLEEHWFIPLKLKIYQLL